MDYTDSMAILKRRLASGEITLEEYEKLKKSI
ncbi:SHOCT domain-containing protein [Desulfovibrio desulfuricans]|nr:MULTISPECIES: SHOCT domain-containing protein [Desulfovibrio]MBD8895729.1 SHOCT domain-containing protein [Desulfovibrio desulfuricans]MCB6543390.1 SHOCT domain-containing protein [Desulfovibrio desulfuricans]MCB6554478.1 SHOCT domain-containing protein [Desulfovibrio desulfuricans]MCB7347479.1 SHOCT domain-containing protein [Desulfovibrio desulfuricans]MCQ4862389.1 SHOCT domain-containing protein [Desulfovibrio desulfuricans]